jgi:phospholipid N-methyltransferase
MNPVITAEHAEISGRTSFVRRAWFVFKAWLRNPAEVATVCPSSPFLTEHLANRDCIQNAERIIELGPGAGGTTQALLDAMRPDAVLLAVEKTRDFDEALDALGDPRLRIAFADACDLIDIVMDHEMGHADVVIAGIPFSSLAESAAKKIIQSIHEVLRPGGVFIAYQLRSDVKDYARPLFGHAEKESIPFNLPPLTAYVWTKASAEQCDHHGDHDNRPQHDSELDRGTQRRASDG